MHHIGLKAFVVCSALAAGRYGFILIARPQADCTDSPASDQTPVTSVLIVAHDEAGRITQTLRAALAAKDVDTVIVADDGSSDETVALVASMAAMEERIKVLPLARMGKIPTLRAALAVVDSEIVVTVDADTLVEPDCVSRLLQQMSAHNLNACAGNLYLKNTRSPAAALQQLEYLVLNGDRAALSRWCAVSVLPGALTAWRVTDLRSLLGSAGSTNDIDLTFAALERGMRLGFAPEAVAFTVAPTSFAGAALQRRRWARRKINRSPTLARRLIRSSMPGQARLAYAHLLTVHVLIALVGWWIDVWFLAEVWLAIRHRSPARLAFVVSTFGTLTAMSVAVYRSSSGSSLRSWWLVGASGERLLRGAAAVSVVLAPERNTATWKPAR